MAPAVSLAVTKLSGTNAADITRAVRQRLEQLQGVAIPDGVNVEITRDYGVTSTDKARMLIQKLVFATLSVVLLVLFTLGWREAVVVGTSGIITLMLTLFADWTMGMIINRVCLFAVILALGLMC